MRKIIVNSFDKWEVSLLKFKEGNTTKFKVTRKFPELSVSETKIFEDLKEAKIQFQEWTD